MPLILPRNRNIPGRTIISTCYPSNCPEAGSGTEYPELIERVTGEVADHRCISRSSEIDPGNAADRPETGGGTEDGGLILKGSGRFTDTVPLIDARNRPITGGAKIEPGQTPDRPEAGGWTEDPDEGNAASLKITRDRSIIQGPEINPGTIPYGPAAARLSEDGNVA